MLQTMLSAMLWMASKTRSNTIEQIAYNESPRIREQKTGGLVDCRLKLELHAQNAHRFGVEELQVDARDARELRVRVYTEKRINTVSQRVLTENKYKKHKRQGARPNRRRRTRPEREPIATAALSAGGAHDELEPSAHAVE